MWPNAYFYGMKMDLKVERSNSLLHAVLEGLVNLAEPKIKDLTWNNTKK